MSLPRWLIALTLAALLLAPLPPVATAVAVAAPPADAGQATLTVLEDSVSVIPGADGAARAAVSGEALVTGDRVRTANPGRALLTFVDGSEAEVGPDSEVLLQALGQTAGQGVLMQLAQASGTTVNRVAKLGAESTYQLQTPSATALVRGTRFSATVTLDPQTGKVAQEELAVDEGTVEVHLRTQTRALQPGDRLRIVPAPGGLETVGGEPVISTGGAAVTAGLMADYQFQNTRASAVGGAPDLQDLGTNSFQSETVDGTARTVLAFPEGNGLELKPTNGLIPSDTYTIAVLFRIEKVDGWRMITDFKNGAGDDALYSYSSDLNFYPVITGTGQPITSNKYVQVVLTRDGNKHVVGYVNGKQQIEFDDTGDLGVIGPDNSLRFFRDNTGVGTEQSAGAVARIRLYDHPLSAGEVGGLDRLP